jgi:hypothetical protein
MALSKYAYKSKEELIEYIQALEYLTITSCTNPIIKLIITSTPELIPLDSKIDLIKTISKLKK